MPVVTRIRTLAALPAPLLVNEPHAHLRVMATEEFYQLILGRLDLKGLAKISVLSRQHRADAVAFLKARVMRYTSPFFHSARNHKSFFKTLSISESWIVASVALAVASTNENPKVPDNLNIIVLYLEDEYWAYRMMNTMGFTLTAHMRASDRYKIVGERFMVFEHSKVPSKRITITTSQHDEIFELFLAGRHTGQLNAVAAHEVITANVNMTVNLTAIEGWRYSGIPSCSPFPGVTISRCTSTWWAECGDDCPARYRFTKGLRGFGHLNWGGMDDKGGKMDPTLVRLGEADLKWHTGYPSRTDPTRAMLSDWDPGHLVVKRHFQLLVAGIFSIVATEHILTWCQTVDGSYPSNFCTAPTGQYLDFQLPAQHEVRLDTPFSVGDWIILQAVLYRHKRPHELTSYRLVTCSVRQIALVDVPPLVGGHAASDNPALLKYMPPVLHAVTQGQSVHCVRVRQTARMTTGPGPAPFILQNVLPDISDSKL
ncbi:hypothetical protein C8J57DRAFT_1505980 [Mycena rebaudengoi]|nr:hypothetical protein C8J57DRAFT_1505980 [Mycena rebaudengoi]